MKLRLPNFFWESLVAQLTNNKLYASSLPIFTLLVKKYVSFTSRTQSLTAQLLRNALIRFEPLSTYYRINDLIWQDGLLIDFVQKKVTDKWMRKFLIISSYLFSERVLFTFVVKFYNDLVIWPSTHASVFELSNVSLMFFVTGSALLTLLLLLNFSCLFALLF